MIDPLESARLKWRRGAHHFETLNREIDAFMASEPYSIRDGYEDEGGWYLGFLVIRRDPPSDLSLLAGDATQNIRATLDHLVCALSGTDCNRTQFPIFTHKVEYGKHRKTMLRGVSATHQAVIDGLQPFDEPTHPLALLRWFTDHDKHRVFHAAFARPHNMRVTRPAPYEVDLGPTKFVGPIENGAELFRFRLVPTPEVKMQVKVEIDLTVGFGEKALSPFDIQDIGARVEHIVEAFADESGPLPPR